MLSEVCIQCNSRHIVGENLCCRCCSHFCAFFALLFASLLQSRRIPPLNSQSGPHGGERAPCDSETPCIGEKGPHEAKGTMELRAHRPEGKRAYTTVKEPTERIVFQHSRMAVDII